MYNGALTKTNCEGALCTYDGVNDTMWTEYGLLEKVSEISGTLFNNFANWAISDNSTKVFYETWTVYNTSNLADPYRTMYFDSFDCASWVLRAFDQLYTLGAKFDPAVKLNYTRLNLFSSDPILLGSYSDIFNGKNQTLIDDVRAFYRTFQKPGHQTVEILTQAYEAYEYIAKYKRFYFFYNQVYWLLNLRSPNIHISYYNIPLPGTTTTTTKSEVKKLKKLF